MSRLQCPNCGGLYQQIQAHLSHNAVCGSVAFEVARRKCRQEEAKECQEDQQKNTNDNLIGTLLDTSTAKITEVGSFMPLQDLHGQQEAKQ